MRFSRPFFPQSIGKVSSKDCVFETPLKSARVDTTHRKPPPRREKGRKTPPPNTSSRAWVVSSSYERMSSYFGSIGSLFQSGPKLSHDILDETTDAVARPFGPWKTFDGKSQETGEMVTIFTCKIKDKEKERGTLELARNGAKRLKLCKHPNVVQVKETLEIENGNEITIHVVTVRCLRRLFARRRLFFGGHTPPNRVTWYDVDG